VNLASATDIKLGTQSVQEVFLGAQKIWPIVSTPTGWREIGKFLTNVPVGAISGDGRSFAIGNPLYTEYWPNIGAVDWRWEQNPVVFWQGISTQYLRGEENDQFGAHVALNSTGERLAVVAQRSGPGAYCRVLRAYPGIGGFYIEILGSEIYQDGMKKVCMNAAGDIVAISAPNGVAKVYQFNGTNWVQRGGSLAIPTSAAPDISLSSSGNRIAVGSNLATDGGRVRVFSFNGSVWSQVGATISISNNNVFAGSIALSGDGTRLVVGEASERGRVHVFFEFSGVWQGQGIIAGLSSTDRFGTVVTTNQQGTIFAATFNQGVRTYQLNGAIFNKLYDDIPAVTFVDQPLQMSSFGNRLLIGNLNFDPEAGQIKIFEF
jgi:hypothetical protein